MDDKELTRVWNQHEIPVIVRRTGKGQLLRMRLPYADSNRTWLQDGRRISPTWIASKRYWEIPKAWFNDVVERALRTYEQIYVIQPYREQEKCSPACLNASSVLMHGRESWRRKRRELVRNLRDLRHALGRSDARLQANEDTAWIRLN
ncbi:hypothetical protein [Sphingobium sp. EP60837]|uniref:hypothetical protein n=1 Tax=Sphingobium sp. EP60837 TaxID=1855519 RepID=UPI0007DDA0B5|nr:hypothetical protein EP837_04036 [Sphingobium sp. EP60837]